MNNVNGSYLRDQVVTSLCHCQKNTDSTASHTRYSPPRCSTAAVNSAASGDEQPLTNLRRLELGR